MATDEYDIQLITTKDIAALLGFLPDFEPEQHFGEPATCDRGQMGCAVLTDKAQAFAQACYKHNFVQSFEWMLWAEDNETLVAEGDGIEHLDLLGIGKLLTTHVRGDRFNDGQLLNMMENGCIAKILRRLQELQGAMAK